MLFKLSPSRIITIKTITVVGRISLAREQSKMEGKEPHLAEARTPTVEQKQRKGGSGCGKTLLTTGTHNEDITSGRRYMKETVRKHSLWFCSTLNKTNTLQNF